MGQNSAPTTRELVPQTEEDWARVRELAKVEGSDGCTGVLDLCVDCCRMHDHFYRTGTHWKDGSYVSRNEADAALRQCYAQKGILWRPVGWVRWLGVRLARPFVKAVAK